MIIQKDICVSVVFVTILKDSLFGYRLNADEPYWNKSESFCDIVKLHRNEWVLVYETIWCHGNGTSYIGHEPYYQQVSGFCNYGKNSGITSTLHNAHADHMLRMAHVLYDLRYGLRITRRRWRLRNVIDGGFRSHLDVINRSKMLYISIGWFQFTRLPLEIILKILLFAFVEMLEAEQEVIYSILISAICKFVGKRLNPDMIVTGKPSN